MLGGYCLAVIIFSIAVQFAAAVYAIWLIKKTGIIVSWCLISAAIFLMGIRRVISFYRLVDNGFTNIDYPMEITGLVLSISMLAGVAGIGRIFIERKRMQQKIEELLKIKDLLLKEVHHRVKNHMNTVSGLLTLQAECADDSKTKEAIIEARGRVDSILALYSRLNASGDYSSVSMADYMSHLVDQIIRNNSTDKKVTVTKEIEDVSIRVDRINYIGIIVNEIMTNSLKYAFTGMNHGIINLKANFEKGNINILIKDNGKGIDFDRSENRGFGMELIRELVESMNGSLTVENDSGACFSLSLRV